MTIRISDAVTSILGQPPVPVLLIDACNLIDLFRSDEKLKKPRVAVEEIQVAVDLVAAIPGSVRAILPGFVPREFADNAGKEENDFEKWIKSQDEIQDLLARFGSYVGVSLPVYKPIAPFCLAGALRGLADRLVAQCDVLEEDQNCLSRAVARVVNKIRPSHKNHLKDSVNLEQCLELSRQLAMAGFPRSRIWVSSNTNDFADLSRTIVHGDLKDEFELAGLKYFTSLNRALSNLRATGEI